MIAAAGFAREHKRAVLRHLLRHAARHASRRRAISPGISEASSTEFGPTPEPIVGLMTEWMRGNMLEKRDHESDLGGTMRLGAYPAILEKGSKIADIYGATEISERHRHRYEININYRDRLEQHGLRFAGLSPDGLLPETVEICRPSRGSSGCSTTRS